MTTFKIAPVICSIIHSNTPVSPENIDLQRYSGKWFVIGTIPTRFDDDWDYTTETYSLRGDGSIDVLTTFIKQGQSHVKELKSKGFPIKEKNNVLWKVRFFWLIKADYLVEEIAEDYSYVVVGHPKKKFLYIMNRSGKMNDELYETLVGHCRQKGYNVSKIRKPKQ